MSGYDKNTFNSSLNILSNRMHIAPKEYNGTIRMKCLTGIARQENRLSHHLQRDRMVYDKRKSLDRALQYSYQASKIRKIQTADGDNREFEFCNNLEESEYTWALINPDKNKMDYDDKIVSLHYEDNYRPGDVFEWIGTNSYWMIYLQDLTEIAYFRGEIRRCSYQINWKDESGNHSTYAAVRGPVETKIDYIQKHGISVDNPNYTLDIYLPKTKETLEYFRRYSKFYLQGEEPGSQEVCWRVEAIDWISTPGILEVLATEYYINEIEDDVENGVVGGLIMSPLDPNDETKKDDDIIGETFIKPKTVYKYTYTGLNAGHWEIDKNCPAKFKVNEKEPTEVYVRWDSSYSGQFELKWGKESKIIVVESLF